MNQSEEINADEKLALTIEALQQLGFRSLLHFTITGSMVFDLGRNRQLSVGCVGSPNEMVWLSEFNDNGIVTDLVCISNYDYDGYFTIAKMKNLLSILNF